MQSDDHVRYFELPERQADDPVPLGPLVEAVEAFEPALHECLLRSRPVLDALGRNDDADAFLIGVHRLLNRLDTELAEHDDEAGGTIVDLLEYRRERAGS